MTRPHVLCLVFLSVLAYGGVATRVAHADGMRCGVALVSDGDTLMDVRDRCGPPDAAMQRTEYRTVRSWVEGPCYKENGVVRCGSWFEQTVQVLIDEWSYDFGPQSFVRHLTFEQGRLLRVATGGYGHKQT
ncbi:MAG: hypothetical protein JWN48_180 [Myxococcaceae bacterium]|nr:hypothetical protein [Myxococcaceae bacterium]